MEKDEREEKEWNKAKQSKAKKEIDRRWKNLSLSVTLMRPGANSYIVYTHTHAACCCYIENASVFFSYFLDPIDDPTEYETKNGKQTENVNELTAANGVK